MAEPDSEKRPEADLGAEDRPAAAAQREAPPPAKAPSSSHVAAAKPASLPPEPKAPSSSQVAAAKPASLPPEPKAAAPSSSHLPAARPASVPPIAKAAPAEPDAEDAITAADNAPVAAAGRDEPANDDQHASPQRASAREPVARPAFPGSAAPSTRSRAATPAAPSPAASARGPLAAYEALALSSRLPDLVAIAQKIIGEAAAARRPGWDHASKVAVAADDVKLTRADADTPYGNALAVLGAGAESEAQRALASALWAHAIAEGKRDDVDRLAGDVLWLATHTPFDATPLLDRALGDEADELWTSIGERVRRIDDGRGIALGRGEAIVGCAAIAAADSTTAQRVASELLVRLKDPTLVRLLGAAAESPLRELKLEGEASSPPRGPFATVVLALTGILFVMHATRLLARVALGYRRPAELSLTESGIRMRTRTEMLGRTLREREHVIVRAGLVRVIREVRYPRAAFYAGLLALAVGSVIGVRAFVDGVRAASPSLLLTGLVVVALGVAADFVLGSVVPGTRGRVSIAFIPRTGKALCLADVDALEADAALAKSLR